MTTLSKARQNALYADSVVNVKDFGAVGDGSTDNTAAFNACLTALGSNGGVIFFPIGDWRGNFLVNQNNITLVGEGGVGETDTTCLRPYLTGTGTYTLKFGNETQYVRKCGLRDIVISGDDGAGNMADEALWLAGGTLNFWARGLDIMDGLHSLHIEPGGTYPATQLKFSQVAIRNDVNLSTARAIYVRKYADATGYVTDLQFHQLKVNNTGNGYWLEMDGTGSTGLVVNFSQTYVDHQATTGGILFTGGLETIEADGGLQLDPGALGTVILTRADTNKDPTRGLRGHILGIGGQKMKLSDASEITFPTEPGLIAYEPLLRRAFTISPIYWGWAGDPYQTSVYEDMTGVTGFKIFTGAQGDGIETPNGARALRGQVSEEFDVDTGAAFTVPSVIQMPANSYITAVVLRIITTIGTAANFTLGDAIDASRFLSTSTSITAGNTVVGMEHRDQTGTSGPIQATALSPRITFNATPSAGRVRMTIFYEQYVAPTS